MWRRSVVGGILPLGLGAICIVVLLAVSDATRTQLTVVGATLEVIGIGLVALDFWAPAAARGLGWLKAWDFQARLRSVVDWLTRRKRTQVSAGVATSWEAAGALTPKLTGPRVTTFDEVSERLQAITDRITTIEGANARAHDKIVNEMAEREEQLRADVQEWIARSKDQYLPWRIAGLVVALSGTVVLAAANLAG
jgi:hypothetical protein